MKIIAPPQITDLDGLLELVLNPAKGIAYMQQLQSMRDNIASSSQPMRPSLTRESYCQAPRRKRHRRRASWLMRGSRWKRCNRNVPCCDRRLVPSSRPGRTRKCPNVLNWLLVKRPVRRKPRRSMPSRRNSRCGKGRYSPRRTPSRSARRSSIWNTTR